MFRPIPSFSRAVRVGLVVGLVLLAGAGAPHIVVAAPPILVDNNGDASGAGCTPAPNDCSLRQAIEAANAVSNATIGFLASYTIVLASSLPAITADDTTIDAGAFTIKIDANNNGRALTIYGNRVLISGLTMYGAAAGYAQIYITNSAEGVKIANNEIGSDSIGGPCTLSPNAYGGIYVDSNGPLTDTVRVWVYGNTIECNLGSPGEGITLYGTDHVKLGEDASSNAGPAQANLVRKNFTGITISNLSTFNSIRNTVIFKNSGAGVWLNNSSFNIVQQSAITEQTSSGVLVDGGSHGNRIGSPAGGPVSSGNTISGNGLDGVHISDAATYSNLLYGNRIGTDASGSAALPNVRNGVMLDNGAHHNVIGSALTERNIISANLNNGVEMDNGAHHNVVQGNIIGANISGTLSLANGGGLALTTGAQNNLIGGPISVTGNLIAGNADYGLYIAGSSTATNTVLYNDMGYSVETGLLPPNSGTNLILGDLTHANVIGGDGAPNFLDFAGGSGIDVMGGAFNNQILKNYVASNGMNGVLLKGSNTAGNVISRTVVWYNGVTCPGCDGIGERSTAGPNRWSEISALSNAGLGIDKFTADDLTNIVNPPPINITGVNLGTGVVTGIADASSGVVSTTVELYRVAMDPSGYGEGYSYLGSAITDSVGNWSIVDPYIAFTTHCYTAFETQSLPGSITSSEFSRTNCSANLPIIRR